MPKLTVIGRSHRKDSICEGHILRYSGDIEFELGKRARHTLAHEFAHFQLGHHKTRPKKPLEVIRREIDANYLSKLWSKEPFTDIEHHLSSYLRSMKTVPLQPYLRRATPTECVKAEALVAHALVKMRDLTSRQGRGRL